MSFNTSDNVIKFGWFCGVHEVEGLHVGNDSVSRARVVFVDTTWEMIL